MISYTEFFKTGILLALYLLFVLFVHFVIFLARKVARPTDSRPSISTTKQEKILSIDPDEKKMEKETESSLKQRLQTAEATVELLQKKIQEKEKEIEMQKKEVEKIKFQFIQSEEILKSELQEIVWDLMEQEKKKKEEFEEKRDEEAFDRLEDIDEEFGLSL